jgi:hypothetical protein
MTTAWTDEQRKKGTALGDSFHSRLHLLINSAMPTPMATFAGGSEPSPGTNCPTRSMAINKKAQPSLVYAFAASGTAAPAFCTGFVQKKDSCEAGI